MSKFLEEIVSRLGGIKDATYEDLSYESIKNNRVKLGKKIETLRKDAGAFFGGINHVNKDQVIAVTKEKVTKAENELSNQVCDKDDDQNIYTKLTQLSENLWFKPYKDQIDELIAERKNIKETYDSGCVLAMQDLNHDEQQLAAAEPPAEPEAVAITNARKALKACKDYATNRMKQVIQAHKFTGVLQGIIETIPPFEYLDKYINNEEYPKNSTYNQLIEEYKGNEEFSIRDLTYAQDYIDKHFKRFQDGQNEFSGYRKYFKPGNAIIKAVSAGIGGLVVAGGAAGGMAYAMPSIKSSMKQNIDNSDYADLKSILDDARNEYQLAKLNQDWNTAQEKFTTLSNATTQAKAAADAAQTQAKAAANAAKVTAADAKAAQTYWTNKAKTAQTEAQEKAQEKANADKDAETASSAADRPAKVPSKTEQNSLDEAKKAAEAKAKAAADAAKKADAALAQANADAAKATDLVNKANTMEAKAMEAETNVGLIKANTAKDAGLKNATAEAKAKAAADAAKNAYNTKAKSINPNHSDINEPVPNAIQRSQDASAAFTKAEKNFDNAANVGVTPTHADGLEVAGIVSVSLIILALTAFITHYYAVEANIEKQKHDAGKLGTENDKERLSINKLDTHIQAIEDFRSNKSFNNLKTQDRIKDRDGAEVRLL